MRQLFIYPDDVSFGAAMVNGRPHLAVILTDADNDTQVKALFDHDDARDTLPAIRDMLAQFEARLGAAN